MAITDSTYFGFTRVRDGGPEGRDWAVIDRNPEIMSLILKAFEGHHHDGGISMNAPAYYPTPVAPTISNQGTLGTTTYSYYVVAKGLTPERIYPVVTTQTGHASPNGTNFNRISWVATPGATGYDVVRVAGNTNQGSISLNQVGLTFDDTNVAASTYIAAKQPTLTEVTSGGVLPPGTNIGVRLSFVNSLGLETDASPENVVALSSSASRPLAPQLSGITSAVNALPGGTYLYVLTKVKGSGETVVSDPLPVNVPYDTTYSASLTFDAINTYTDGTTALNIYRTLGLSSSFQLVGHITTTSTTTFTDNNTSVVSQQPPSTNTFDAARKVTIDWSDIYLEPLATKLRVYVTQQPGVWGTSSMLSEIDLTTGPANFIDYLGSETLLSGWPKNSTEIPASPPKLNLGTEATGAPTLTADMDFAGFKAKNMNINFIPTVTTADGLLWYDSSTFKFRGRANGTTVDLSQTVTKTNTVNNPNAAVGGSTWSHNSNPARVTYSSFDTVDFLYGNSSSPVSMPAGGTFTGTVRVIPMDSSTYTTAGLVVPGEVVSASMAYKFNATGLTATPTVDLMFRFWDAAGTLIGGADVVPTGPNKSSGTISTSTWNHVAGYTTVPSTAAYATPLIYANLTALPGGSSQFLRVDGAIQVSGIQSDDIAYFDGNSSLAYWKGTTAQSASVLGGFQHSIEEVGGHIATNIRHHTGASTPNVKTILDRYVDSSTGVTKQVLGPTKWLAPFTTRTTSSTSPVGLDLTGNSSDLMTIAQEFANQWYEVSFTGHFTVDTVGATLSIGIERAGSVVDTTIRSMTAPSAGASISLAEMYIAQMTGTESFRVLWWVSAGTATAVSGRQRLVHRMLI